MKQSFGSDLRFVSCVVLILSLALNVAFYVRLSQSKGKPAATSNDGPSKELVQPAAPVAPVAPFPVPPDSVVSSDGEKSGKPEKRTLYFQSSSFSHNGKCDGKFTEGTLSAYVSGINWSKNIKEKISVSPKPNGKLEIDTIYNTIHLDGTFEINANYTITIKKGMIFENGYELEDDYSMLVKISEPSSSLEFTSNGPYYPCKVTNGIVSEWRMPINYVNVKEAMVILWGLEERNMDISENLMRSYWDDDSVVDRLFQRIAFAKCDLKYVRNLTIKDEIDLTKLFPNLKPGVYEVRVVYGDKLSEDDANGACGEECRRKVVLSDLAISAVAGALDGRMAVSVHHMSDFSPVADAELTLISFKRAVLSTGRTSQDGTAILEFDPNCCKNSDSPETIIAKRGSEISYIRLEDANRISTSEFNDNGKVFKEAYYPFVYTERGIYRPGESISIASFVRYRKDGGMQAAHVPLEFSVKDPMNTVIFSKTVETDDNGFATVGVELSETAVTGNYAIECKAGKDSVGSAGVIVGAFTPDRIKVNAKLEKPVTDLQERQYVWPSSEYYFGGNVTGVVYSIDCQMRPDFPKHWKDYHVGRVGERNYRDWSYSVGKFNSGAARIAIKSIEEMAEGSTWKKRMMTLPLCVTVSVGATEPGAATVTGNFSYYAMRTPFFLGLRHIGAEGRNAALECKLLKWDEKADIELPKLHIDFKLNKLTWEYVLVKKSGNEKMEWTQKSEEVAAPESVDLTDAFGKIVIPQLQNGQYQLTATAENGLETTLEFWHYEGDASTVHSSNPNVLVAQADKELYQPGDTATVKFSSRSEGTCFVAAGENSIEYTASCNVKKGDNEITVPIAKGALTANYFVSLSLANVVNDNLTRSFALLKLPVDQKARDLELKMTAPDRSEPGKSISIELAATQGATAQIFAVDEGILSLTNFKTPDIFEFFHGLYASQFKAYDFYGRLYPRLAIAGFEKSGGDGETERASRILMLKQKKNAVVVLGTVKIPEGQSVKAEMRLPDHSGAMRIMAVAAGHDKVGSCDSSIVLRDAATVLPSLPLVAAPKDSFVASFKLFNHDLDAEDAELKITLPPELATEAATEFKVKVAKGGSATCSIPVNVLMEGACTVKYSMSIGDRTVTGDSVVNVRSVMPYSTATRNFVLKPGESIELAPVDAAWSRLDKSEATMMTSPAYALADGLDWLNRYPYGCLEQTTSMAFPYLSVENLIAAGVVPEDFKLQSQKRVDAATMSILSMSRGTRGFVSWPDSDFIWEDVGVYAAHFLMLSGSKAFTDVSRGLVLEYLHKEVNGYHKDNATFKAYALYVITLDSNAAKKSGKLADRLLKESAKNSLAAFLAGAALYNSGQAVAGAAIMKEALDTKVWERNEKLPWFFASDTSRTAFVLSIAMDMLPDHPATVEMAMQLAKSLRNDGSFWGATRDNSLSVCALAKFVTAHPAGKGEVTMNFGQDKIQKIAFDKNGKADIPSQAKTLLTNSGDADVFVLLKNSGIPAELKTDTDTIAIKKEILDKDGKVVTKVKNGDLLTVRITVNPMFNVDDAVLLDLLPGGFVIEDGSLATRSGKSSCEGVYVIRQESLGDRYLLFGKIGAGRKMQVVYNIRAVIPGTFAVPPVRMEDMYAVDKAGTGFEKKSITVE